MFKIPWTGRSVDYTQEDKDAVLEAMTTDPQTQGKYLTQFEKVFSDFHGGRPSFAVSSGAAALEIAAMLLNLSPDDEVIIPAHTYCATAIPFARRGVKIKWADIHPKTRTVVAETIKPLITEKTKAIVVVHLYGCNAPIHCIMELAWKHKIPVIEDCAQSLGVHFEFKIGWDGQDRRRFYKAFTPPGRSGTHGDIAIYSFHGQKNITTLGEGGMIMVRDSEYAQMIPGLRHNGHRSSGDLKVMDFDIPNVYPYNFSIGEAQCAVGVSQMARLDAMNAERYDKARHIIDWLSDIKELEFQETPRGSTHTYHLLNARYPKRDRLVKVLAERYGIECVVQYMPLYRYPLFSNYAQADCPNTEEFYKDSLSFPFAGWYTFETIEYLRNSIRAAIEGDT